MRYQGKIVKWNEAKGYGFIMPKGGNQSVFVHVRGFSSRKRRPLDNLLVSYALGSDTKGRCCAVNVRYADEKSSTIELRISVLPMLLAMFFVALLIGVVLAGYAPLIISILYFALSLAAFLAYALDKSAAETGRWRIQENTLHILGLAGGWPGAVFAQQLLRHKSSKREFQMTFWLTVMLNGGALTWLVSPYGTEVRALLSRMV